MFHNGLWTQRYILLLIIIVLLPASLMAKKKKDEVDLTSYYEEVFQKDDSEVAVQKPHSAKVNGVAWTPDSKYFTTCSDDYRVILWDKHGLYIREYVTEDPVNDIEASNDGLRFHVARTTKNDKRPCMSYLFFNPVRFVENINGVGDEFFDPRWKLVNEYGGASASAVAESPDGQYRAYSYYSDKDPSSGGLIIRENIKGVFDRKFEYSANDDCEFGKTPGYHWNYHRVPAKISDLQFHPSKPFVAVALNNGTIIFRSAKKEKTELVIYVTEKVKLKEPPRYNSDPDWEWGHINDIEFNSTGDLIAAACSDGYVYILDTKDGDEVQKIKSHDGSVSGVAWSSDDSKLYTACDDGKMRVWSADGKLILTSKDSGKEVVSLGLSPDNTTIIGGCSDGSVVMWNSEGIQLRTISGSKDGYKWVLPSEDDNYFLVDQNSKIDLFSTDGRHVATLLDPAGDENFKDVWGINLFGNFCFSGDGNKIIGMRSIGLVVWDINGNKLKEINIQDASGGTLDKWMTIYGVYYADWIRSNKKGDKIYYIGYPGKDYPNCPLVSINLETGVWDTLTYQFIKSESEPRHFDIDEANGEFAVVNNLGTIGVYDLNTGETKKIHEREIETKESINDVAFRNGKVAFMYNQNAYVYDVNEDNIKLYFNDRSISRKMERESQIAVYSWQQEVYDFSDIKSYTLSLSPDGKYLATTYSPITEKRDKYLGSDWKAGVYTTSRVYEGVVTAIFDCSQAKDEAIVNKYFSADGKDPFIAWNRKDNLNTYTIINDRVEIISQNCSKISDDEIKTSKLKYVASGNEWIVIDTKEGYFDSSRNGGKLVSAVQGVYGWPIDQFAVRLNRPDIIMTKLGFDSPEMINHYYNQYKKRLRRMKIDEASLTSDFKVPRGEILSSSITGNEVKLDIKFEDQEVDLVNYNIWVNDVPVFGAYGKEISGKQVSLSENVKLTPGFNRIEVSATNKQGAESYRASTFVSYNGQVNPDLYVLTMGVSNYKDSSLNLKYADQDAIDLSELLQKYQGKGFGNVFVKKLVNEDVTVDAIKSAKDFLQNSRPEDTFIMFIAGHGVHDTDKEATYYYLTHEAEIGNLAETAANFDLIEDIMQGIAPRKKLFLMDTCESGEADEEIETGMLAMASSRGLAARTTRGLKKKMTAVVEKPKPRSYVLERDRFIYNDLIRRSGAIVLSSSRGGEFSYERDELANGLFTEELLKTLTSGEGDLNNDGQLDSIELRKQLSKAVAELSNNLQHPTVDRDNIYIDFSLPVLNGSN